MSSASFPAILLDLNVMCDHLWDADYRNNWNVELRDMKWFSLNWNRIRWAVTVRVENFKRRLVLALGSFEAKMHWKVWTVPELFLVLLSPLSYLHSPFPSSSHPISNFQDKPRDRKWTPASPPPPLPAPKAAGLWSLLWTRKLNVPSKCLSSNHLLVFLRGLCVCHEVVCQQSLELGTDKRSFLLDVFREKIARFQVKCLKGKEKRGKSKNGGGRCVRIRDRAQMSRNATSPVRSCLGKCTSLGLWQDIDHVGPSESGPGRGDTAICVRREVSGGTEGLRSFNWRT